MAALPSNPRFNQPRQPVDYVNPNIGTLSWKTWSTSPTVQLPHGMLEIDPLTTPGIGDRYLADKIYGFTFNAAAWAARLGQPGPAPADNASEFDHDQEIAAPYYYAVLLEDYDILAEFTAAERAGFGRFTFPAGEPPCLLLYLGGSPQFQVIDARGAAGSVVQHRARMYFYAEFSRPFREFSTLDARTAAGPRRSPELSLAFHFDPPPGGRIAVRCGVSYISVDQARENLGHELPDWDFEDARLRARTAWNDVLQRIQVEGGTEDQKTIFYTALYRNLGRMKNLTEYDAGWRGRYFSGFDGKVHEAGGRCYYTADQPWDTYRCARPLQAILEPERFNDFLQSYVWMYQQSGWMPKTPQIGGDFPTMVGWHVTAIIADGFAKGFRGFDLETAYEGLRKNALQAAMLPWKMGPLTELEEHYDQRGYYPALPVRESMRVEKPEEWREQTAQIIMSQMPYQITWLPEVGVDEWVAEVDPWHRRQSVSVTLEHAYDDWCLAQLAKALGRDEDYARFIRRAGNYRNLYNPRTGFMSPRTAGGEWVEPFDPKLSGGFAGEAYFAEMNAWTYTFHVQHDLPGLIELTGGRQAFVERLNALFTEQYTMDKPAFLGQFPDMSGLIGQYAHGNEPSFHIPYLYNYAGAPWRTQRRVRDIMNIWYNAGPMGLCGDDDIGSLSSWYAFSAMGFYPVCPGRPVYDIGSPVFEHVKLDLGQGRTFTIHARGVSQANKYIQAARLGGQPLERPWFSHTDLLEAGRLELLMGPRPDPAWGRHAELP